MDEISIDRLIFDIPGLNVEQARDLAQCVGEELAVAVSNTEGFFDALAVNLNSPATRASIPRLAESIVRALLSQMGGH